MATSSPAAEGEGPAGEGRQRALSRSGESLYLLLGLQKSATLDEIKKSYRRKALTCHPDKNQGDETATELFKQINHANAVLTDETKRKIYDAYGSMGLHLASQVGEDRFKSLLILDHPCSKILLGFLCLITGCCFCCCCCACCNCCCGKCAPKAEYDENYQGYDDIAGDGGGAGGAPIIAQPTSANDSTHDDKEKLMAEANPNTPIVLGPPGGSAE